MAKQAAAKKTTAVAKRETKTTAVAGVPDYGQYAGAGAEDITSDDFLLPFVRIIQTNSPELLKKSEKYIEGAEAGMFFNVATRKLYGDNPDEGFTAHLCYKDRYFAEFIPRDQGGGFVQQHAVDDPTVEKLRAAQGKFGKLKMSDGNEIVETYAGFFIVNGDDPEAVAIPFASTGITPFKQFLMLLNPLLRKGIPIFAPRVRISTRSRTNKEGTFFVPVLQLDGDGPEDYLLAPDDELVEVCANLRASVASGAVKANMKTLDNEDGNDTEEF